jgi:hypothetical protein
VRLIVHQSLPAGSELVAFRISGLDKFVLGTI